MHLRVDTWLVPGLVDGIRRRWRQQEERRGAFSPAQARASHANGGHCIEVGRTFPQRAAAWAGCRPRRVPTSGIAKEPPKIRKAPKPHAEPHIEGMYLSMPRAGLQGTVHSCGQCTSRRAPVAAVACRDRDGLEAPPVARCPAGGARCRLRNLGTSVTPYLPCHLPQRRPPCATSPLIASRRRAQHPTTNCPLATACLGDARERRPRQPRQPPRRQAARLLHRAGRRDHTLSRDTGTFWLGVPHRSWRRTNSPGSPRASNASLHRNLHSSQLALGVLEQRMGHARTTYQGRPGPGPGGRARVSDRPLFDLACASASADASSQHL